MEKDDGTRNFRVMSMRYISIAGITGLVIINGRDGLFFIGNNPPKYFIEAIEPIFVEPKQLDWLQGIKIFYKWLAEDKCVELITEKPDT
jgi:hypothetical protein